MAYFLNKYHDEHTLQKYWKSINSLRTQFGNETTRQNKSCWIGKMRNKITKEEIDRDLRLYSKVLQTTGGLKELEDHTITTENLHTEAINLFNLLIQKHPEFNDFDKTIDMFNRTWIMDDPKTREITRYRKRGKFYLMSLTVNSWTLHFILYLLISAY